jgi:hypothetical protein
MLTPYFDNVSIVKNFTNKETHGDIDIICSSNNDINFDKLIKMVFKPVEIFHNGNCHSFDYDSTQIDLITCGNEDYETYKHYYDYGFGNYFGKIAQSIGFKYGMEGLWINHFIGQQNKFKIMVSKDFRKIYEFLGYDYNRFLKGFENIEDIYDFVMTSKYYTPHIFQIENLTKINRGRDVRRQSYMDFLTYSEGKGDHSEYNYQTSAIMKMSNEKTIKSVFPEVNIDLKFRELEYGVAKKRYINAKFNGKMIIDRYGLTGKELGQAINKFKNDIGWIHERSFPNFDTYILKTKVDKIFKEFESSNGITPI